MKMEYKKPTVKVVNISSEYLCSGSGTIESGGPIGGGNHGINGAKSGFFDIDDVDTGE